MGYTSRLRNKRLNRKKKIINLSLFIIINVVLFLLILIYIYQYSNPIVNLFINNIQKNPSNIRDIINNYGKNSTNQIQSQFNQKNVTCLNFLYPFIYENEKSGIEFSNADNSTDKEINRIILFWCIKRIKRNIKSSDRNISNNSLSSLNSSSLDYYAGSNDTRVKNVTVSNQTKQLWIKISKKIPINFTDILYNTNLSSIYLKNLNSSETVSNSIKALKSQLGKELNHLGIDTTKINIYKNFLILVTIIIILLYFINNGWIISIHRIGDILASYSGLFLILIIILPYLKSSYINSGTNIKMTLLVIVIFLELISSYVYYFVILLVIGIILILIAEYFAKAVLVENYEKRLTKEIENEKNELYKKEKQQ